MQFLNRALHQWFQGFMQIYSLQLLIIVVLIGGIVRYLTRERDQVSERRFVGLSVVAGLLGILAVGAAFRTPTVAEHLGLKAGSIVEQQLSWIKAIIALTAAGLCVYEGILIAQKK